MDDLRRCWKVPYIVYYCNLFEQRLDLIDLRVDDFEEAILDDCGTERNIVVIHLLQKLLKPFINRSIDLTNYEQFLLSVLKKYNLESLYLQENSENQWSNLSMLTKLDIIYWLCELRLQLVDVETKLTDYEPSALRIEPLGIDSNGKKLWYFGDLRLYQELPPPPSPKPTSKKSLKTNKKSNKASALPPKNKNSAQHQKVNASTKSKSNVKKQTPKNLKTTNKQIKATNKRGGRRSKSKKSSSSDDDEDDDDEEEEEEEEEEDEEDESKIDIEFDEELLDEEIKQENQNGDDEAECSTDEEKIVNNKSPVKETVSGRSRRLNVSAPSKYANALTSSLKKNNIKKVAAETSFSKSPITTAKTPSRLNESSVNLRRSSRRSTRGMKDEDEHVEIEKPMNQEEIDQRVSNENSNDTNENEMNTQVNDVIKNEEDETLVKEEIKEETDVKFDVKEENPDLDSNSKSPNEPKQESVVDMENTPPVKEEEERQQRQTEENDPIKTELKTEEQLEKEKQSQLEEEKQFEQDKKDMLEMMEIINRNKLEKQQNVKHIEELDYYKQELETWSCVCLTLEDWSNINDKYKKSKKKGDQEIAKLISESYLPEMPALFQKAEKERMQRLLAMAPKRQSQRLQVKQQTRTEFSENESKDNAQETYRSGHSMYKEYNSDGDLDDSMDDAKKSGNEYSNLPLTEQERLKRDDIARQREERLRQRLLKRENKFNLNENSQQFNQDDNSQGSNASHYSGFSMNNIQHSHGSSSSDFNIRNYFLMHKVLTKVLQSKYAWPFKNAVSEDDAPDYNTIIETPMDLSTIQLRINSKTYKSRQAFVHDMDLIVKNCFAYNGEESFYGKIASKFDNYFKRWLHIYFPREISTSLEEKNRQLMKLIGNRSNLPGEDLANGDSENKNINTNSNSLDGGELGDHDEGNASHPNDETRPSSLLFDFSNNTEMIFTDGSSRKKRKPNPDKEKYLQEPQYVTKRSSSGRLVKMKIINDFDYTSDQEMEGKRKKNNENDENDTEGIQKKHRKQSGHDSYSSLSSDGGASDNSEDEDFLGGKASYNKNKVVKIRVAEDGSTERPKRVYTKTPGRPRQRRTIKELTEGSNSNRTLYNEESSNDDDDLVDKVLKNRNQCDNDSDNDLNLTDFNKQYVNGISNSNVNGENSGQAPKLTFEQYVKKLTGNYAVGQSLSTTASAVAAKVNATISSSPKSAPPSKTALLSNQLEGVARFSLKVAPAPSVQKPLTQQSTIALSVATDSPVKTQVVSSTVTTTTVTPASPNLNITSSVTGISQKQQSLNINSNIHSSISQNFYIAKSQPSSIAANNINNISHAQKTVIQESNKSTTAAETANDNSSINLSVSTNSSSIQQLTSNKKYVIINPINTLATTLTNATQLKPPTIIQSTNQPKKIINISQLTSVLKPTTSISAPNLTSTANQIRTQILSPILNRPQVVMINTSNMMQNKILNAHTPTTVGSNITTNSFLNHVTINNSSAGVVVGGGVSSPTSLTSTSSTSTTSSS